ncbi:MAG: TolC family protein [Zavarzinella sp.]
MHQIRYSRIVRLIMVGVALVPLPACIMVHIERGESSVVTPLPESTSETTISESVHEVFVPPIGGLNKITIGGTGLSGETMPPPVTPDTNEKSPINLPAALKLADASPIDVQIAEEQIAIAQAQLDRANIMWVPNLNIGVDYFRHDGQIQDIVGTVFATNRSSFLAGGGPQAIVSVSDAFHEPLVAKQRLNASIATAQAQRNDTTLQVALSYFQVQQHRGEVAGALDSLKRAEELAARIEKLAPDLTPDVEVNRVKTEVARRRQSLETAYENWQVASAELARLLRLQPNTVLTPVEDPALQLNLFQRDASIDQLCPLALTHRPELAAHQALIQAALARLDQEKARPFLPTIAVRGVGSNTPGLAGGTFGGGIDNYIGDFAGRFSVDVQAVWELQNLGFGNAARVREREAEQRQSMLELLRMKDQVIADVTQAHAQLTRAAKRMEAASSGLENAVSSADKNLTGLSQTKRVGEQILLVIRPQEAISSVSMLQQAYQDYYQAIADYNRAQFRLYRAVGHSGTQLKTFEGAPEVKTEIQPSPTIESDKLQ